MKIPPIKYSEVPVLNKYSKIRFLKLKQKIDILSSEVVELVRMEYFTLKKRRHTIIYAQARIRTVNPWHSSRKSFLYTVEDDGLF